MSTAAAAFDYSFCERVLQVNCFSETTHSSFSLTVNSKAEVRFHLASADWIPEDVRQKMAVLVIVSLSLPNIVWEILHSSDQERQKQNRGLAVNYFSFFSSSAQE